MLDFDVEPNLDSIPSDHWLVSLENKDLHTLAINLDFITPDSLPINCDRVELQNRIFNFLIFQYPQTQGKDFKYNRLLHQTQLTPNTKRKISDYLNITNNDSGIENSNRLSNNFNLALEETFIDLEIISSFRLNYTTSHETVKKSIISEINELFTNPKDFINFLINPNYKNLPTFFSNESELLNNLIDKYFKPTPINKNTSNSLNQTLHTANSSETLSDNESDEEIIMTTKYGKPSTYAHSLNEDINNFVNKFENECDAFGWNDDAEKLKKIKIAFTDVAEERFNDVIKPLNLPSWNAMKAKLIEIFNRTTPILQSQLNKIIYQGDDCFYEYINNINKLMKRINPQECETNIVSRILKGLPIKQKEFFCIRGCKNIEDIRKLFPQWIEFKQQMYSEMPSDALDKIKELEEKNKALENKLNGSNTTKINMISNEVSSNNSDNIVEQLKSILNVNAINNKQYRNNFSQNNNYQRNNNPQKNPPNQNPNPNYKGNRYDPNFTENRRNNNSSRPNRYFQQNFSNQQNSNRNQNQNYRPNSNFQYNNYNRNNNFRNNNAYNNRNYNNNTGPNWKNLENLLLGNNFNSNYNKNFPPNYTYRTPYFAPNMNPNNFNVNNITPQFQNPFQIPNNFPTNQNQYFQQPFFQNPIQQQPIPQIQNPVQPNSSSNNSGN
ncbi:hypothetical protein V9T40_000560 [Parthenolecanium corni]|uniref:Retrotransposon gag domain-containing protein n=1 Tax=Parthenolecanium corni TaxID=536013 RepID=A0AAN9TQN9_9HEMI